jgi:hypothetical protein
MVPKRGTEGATRVVRGGCELGRKSYRVVVALIGDAAGTSDPSFGCGLSLTLRDACVLRDYTLASRDWHAAAEAYARKHTAPGSYRLANDLKAPVNQDCLVISTFNVTLDLDGHVVTNDFFTGTGIRDSGHPEVNSNITVSNGTVSGWGKSGIDLSSTSTAVVENVTVIGSGQVRNNTLDHNQNVSILVNGEGIISGNYVGHSGGFAAIALGSAGNIVNNTVFQSAGDGINAAPEALIAGYVVTGNSVRFSGGAGVNVNCPSLVSLNASFSNKGANIRTVPIDNGACTSPNNSG